jgi:hypothetical protein
MAITVGLTPTISTRGQTWDDKLVAKFPDLDQEDRVLVGSFFDAFTKKEAQPDRYQNARSSLITQVKRLQSAADVPEQSPSSVPKPIARLIDLNEVMKMANFPSSLFLEPRYYSRPVADLRVCSLPDAANALSDEIKVLLDVGEGEKTFLSYYSLHVRHIFFAKELKAEVKIFLLKKNPDKFCGINETGTRTVIVDTWREGGSREYEPWEQAATIVHETAHIDYAYRAVSDPARQGPDWSERFACIVKREYLDILDEKGGLPDETRWKIRAASREMSERIKNLNNTLGLEPDDYLV